MHGVCGIYHSNYNYPSARAADQTPPASTSTPSTNDPGSAAGATGASSGASAGGAAAGGAAAGGGPGSSQLSGQNAIEAMLGNSEQVTGGVTATLPDGMTIGVWSLSGAESGQGASGSDASSGSGSASDASPDYYAMEAALEQMVDQFMANQSSGAAASAAQAYGAQPSSPPGAAQGANIVA
jgi:hypothetical protein